MDDYSLVVTSGSDAGRSLPINEELILGRSVGGVGQLGGDPDISRRHARITRRSDGRLVIEDLRSANGTYVNGVRLVEAGLLQHGDAIRVGLTELALQAKAQASSRSVPEVDASLLHAGERIRLAAGGATVGRAEDSTIRIGSELASRHHARFDLSDDGRYSVTDLGSTNGTYLNGQRLSRESRWLANGDTVTVGREPIRFLTGEARQLGGQVSGVQVAGTRAIKFDGTRLTLGRDPSNDVVLPNPNVSRFHAEVLATADGYELRDLGSRNGTRLDGHLIGERAAIQTGSEIGVGPFRLIFDGAVFLARDDRGSLRLDAEQLIVDVKGKRILDNASIEIQPGEFVAIIGESGSGKTTLIKALAGVSDPSSGTVTVNGEPVSSRLSEIGYVPQDEIVHRDLTVNEALTYAARLRLPQDTRDAEIQEVVRGVISELGLAEHSDTRIGSLSGGQRKRAGVGTELVNHPGLLYLDEATTGLDPGLETRMMQLMRDLARTRAVVTITHATKNLKICDKIVVMGRGGLLCFYGTPDDALSFFEVRDYDDIYLALDATPATRWRQRWQAGGEQDGAGTTLEQPRAAAVMHRQKIDRKVIPQALILAGRYIRLISRDRRNLLILLGQVPVLAVLIAALFPTDVFRLGAPRQAGASIELIFLLLTLAIWLGSIDAVREIIKERAVFARERAVGVRTSAYLVSKSGVLFGLATIQTLILCAIVFGLRRLDAPVTTYLEVAGIAAVTSWVAVAMGLALSALVNTENQAMSLIPLALIPQLLFGGQLRAIREMPGVLRAVATVTFSRWSFAGLGGTLHFYHRIALDPTGKAQLFRYGGSFFKLALGPTFAILAGFIAVLTIGVVLGLRRRPT
jgi:ABC-type multidrug transport system ATPase subunit/ABC-type multidrug transport system permease subunit